MALKWRRLETAAVGAGCLMALGIYLGVLRAWGLLAAGFRACEATGEDVRDYFLAEAARDTIGRR